MMDIYQRLNAVMQEPGAAYIQKDPKKINNQYTAVSHDDVARKLHPLFAKHGIVVLPSCISATTVETGRKTRVGSPIVRLEGMFRVRFVAAGADRLEGGQVTHTETEVVVPAHADDEGDKAPGKALSYATKYALLKVLMIESGDEEEERVSGTGDGQGDGQDDGQRKPPPLNEDTVKAILETIRACDTRNEIGTALQTAMDAAKEADDKYAAAIFREAAATRAQELDKKAAKTTETAGKQASPPSVIKVLRKKMDGSDVGERAALAALSKADRGDYKSLDEITKEDAVYLMNEVLTAKA